MKYLNAIFTFSVLVAFMPLPSTADIYKTIDENGRTVFSQIPPSKDAQKYQVSKENNVSNQSSSNTSTIEKQKKYLDYLTDERLERKEQKDKIKREKKEQQDKCNLAKADLEELNRAGSRYYELDDQGNRVVIGYERIEAEINDLKNYIKGNCG